MKVLVSWAGGPWEGLYVDGTLVNEDHEVPVEGDYLIIELDEGRTGIEYSQEQKAWIYPEGIGLPDGLPVDLKIIRSSPWIVKEYS